MGKMMKVELTKAFRGRFFLAALGIALLIALLQVVYQAENYQSYQESVQRAELFMQEMEENYEPGNPYLQEYTLFNHWLCTDYVSLTASLFWFLIPILAPLAYGWSLFLERRSGYIKNAVLRSSRAAYFFSKLAAVFLAGGTVATVPAILNVLLVALFVPAVQPDIAYSVNYPVTYPTIFSWFFYAMPVLYVALRLLLNFVFAGTLATLSYSLSFWVHNRFAVVLLPFLLALALTHLQSLIPAKLHYAEFSPMYIMGANGFYYELPGVVLAEIGIPLALSLILAAVSSRKCEIF